MTSKEIAMELTKALIERGSIGGIHPTGSREPHIETAQQVAEVFKTILAAIKEDG